MGMSEFYGPGDDDESIATIHRALDLGVTFLDTSDMYGPYLNEELVGRAIAGRRDEVVLATKFGIVRAADPADRSIRGDAAYVREACEASLGRLGVDHIDLYYQHRTDAEGPHRGDRRRHGRAGGRGQGPLPRPVGGRAGHHAAGVRRPSRSPRCRASGRCGAGTSRTTWCRTARELGIGIVAYSPLGRGFLTGQITSPDDFPEGDFRPFLPRFTGENFAHNIELVDTVRALAAAKGCTPGQLALAWVLARGDDVVPIPGTKRRTYLEENVAAVDVVLDRGRPGGHRGGVPVRSVAADRVSRHERGSGVTTPRILTQAGPDRRAAGQSRRRTVTTLP